MTFDEQVAMYVYLHGTLADAAFVEIAYRLNAVIEPCEPGHWHRDLDEDVTEGIRKIYRQPYEKMTPEQLFAESLRYAARRCSRCGMIETERCSP